MWQFSTYKSIPALARAIHAEALGGYFNREKFTVEELEHYLRAHLDEHIRMGCFPKLHARREFDDGKRGVQRDTFLMEVARETGHCALAVERQETWCDAELMRKRSQYVRPIFYSNEVVYTFMIADDTEESKHWWAMLESDAEG